MPLLNNIVSSIKTGWANLNNEDNLTMLSFLSVTYIFLIYFNYSLISNSIYSGSIQLFGITLQAQSLFICTMALASSISLFLGAFFSERYHLRLQLLSSILGILFGFFLYLPIQGEAWIIFYATLAGAASSIGLTNILAAFISKTDFSNRGSTSGIFTFLVYIILFILAILVSQLSELAIVLVILKIFSLWPSIRIKEFKFDKEVNDNIQTTPRVKLSFILVWAFFIISNIAVNTYLESYIIAYEFAPEEVIEEILMTSQIIGLFAIFLGGILMDVYGRKRLMMFSFAYLGATYALISFSRGLLYWFTVLDGIGWGILTVMFLLVLWGDLCKPSKRTIWMAASLSFSIALYPAMIIAPHLLSLAEKVIEIQDLFPITAFFLFLAVVIILYLPETLPEKIIQKKELDDYIHMAKKVKEKYKKTSK